MFYENVYYGDYKIFSVFFSRWFMNFNLIWGKVDWVRWIECKNEDNYMWIIFVIGYFFYIV